ncbi:hypothetical protein POPTR_007G110201v4 [Populus trichocarpa]|uniref:Uncharacterized protein n=1 Tax=Populus trichocarpa TaxID=3694 RepID=A0ACC0SQS7_POPTR|nr:hypothetical protein POPTR_007G110201v4 [Populus trichocarpa]
MTSKDLSVMDGTAITLCQENNIPVVVFNLSKPGNIAKARKGWHIDWRDMQLKGHATQQS